MYLLLYNQFHAETLIFLVGIFQHKYNNTEY